MTASKTCIRTLAATTALLAVGTAQAQVTMYTDLASWQAAVTQADHDYFSDLPIGDHNVPNMDRQTAGGLYTYTISTQGSQTRDSLWTVGGPGHRWIGNAHADGALFIHGLSPAVTAVALFGVTSDASGLPVYGGIMNVSACPRDVNAACAGDSYATTFELSDFRGFVSTDGFRYVSAFSDGSSAYPTISALHLAAAVPEPGTYALLLAGLAGIGWISRRRAA